MRGTGMEINMNGYPTLYDDVVFIETAIQEASAVSYISVDLSFKFGAQLKCLTDVKSGLAIKAKNLNCNCVMEFKYGQKSRWLAIDDVAHFGNGMAAKLSLDKYNEIIEYIHNRDK